MYVQCMYMLWLGPIITINMAFYVKTYYALRLGKNKRGISFLSCYVSKETENVMRRKKMSFSRCVQISHDVACTLGLKLTSHLRWPGLFLCNIRPSHVVTLWNKMFEVFMKQNTHNMSKKNLEEFIIWLFWHEEFVIQIWWQYLH